jgi:ATP-dependent Clp protease ATP-binding subunit ClpB
MTSNLGSDLWMNGKAASVTRDAITQVLQAHFRPEFLNRIDEIIMFHSLSRADLVQVVDIQLRHVTALLAERGYRLVISPEARSYLAEVGYDADYGARPLKRAIQRELQDPLAVKILGGEFHEGETVHVERGKQKLEFTAQATAQPGAP